MVLAFPLELQKKLLHFATGSDRVPVGGMADLNFKIAKIEVSTDWWVSHADRTETRTDSVKHSEPNTPPQPSATQLTFCVLTL